MNQNLISKVKTHFINTYKTQPILIFSPGRINIIGEHTDYNEGLVLPAATDKGIIAALNKNDSKFCSVSALDQIEQLKFSRNNIQSIKNGGWKNYVLGVVAEIQKSGKILENFDLVFSGDLPIGSGLSSSAALENCIVFGLNELFRLDLSKKEMIFISQKAEHNYVGVNCGIMDQYASMFGVENSALLLDCRNLEAYTLNIDFRDFEILLINTNVKHSLNDSAYNNRRSVCEKIAGLLNINALRDATENDLNSIKDQISIDEYQKGLYVIQENKRVILAVKALKNNDIEQLGQLLYATHEGLKNQYKVSCDELDFLVDKAKEDPHILGARMMGGGFGGCTINLLKKPAMEGFTSRIRTQFKKKFNSECDVYNVHLSQGTHLIKT